ncbi:uncharacterized protein LOC125230913 [Leguminivora glycinivorella]|uniref:uncharacterized protein LOC125230913 n=1 Tax=Leguminivora glycinivorella TaxID=1035111 RepID=UPI00200F76D4|nr:uncharacterized protein LOC125230913 [Leguminivora glycinivorella]
MRFYSIDQFEFVNDSATRFDLTLGLWTSYKVYILLSTMDAGPQFSPQYYEFQVGAWHPRLFPVGGAALHVRTGPGRKNLLVRNYTFPREQPWLLTWKEFRPFIIRLVTGEKSQSLTFEAAGNRRVLISHQGEVPLKIKYVAFATLAGGESKVFFDCPPFRLGNIKDLSKSAAMKLSQVDLPTCPEEPCAKCPRVYLPVCSTQYHTYRNECFFRCLQPDRAVSVLHKGLCMHWLWQWQWHQRQH